MTWLPVLAGFGTRRMVAGLVLGFLVSQQALAQGAPATENPAAGRGAAVQATTAPPASTPSAPAYVAPGAIEAAWLELRAIQQREQALWKEQANVNLGPPAAAIAVGAPMFGVMLPIGGYILAQSSYNGVDEHGVRVGKTLIALGVIGFVALVTGTTALARQRRKRLQGNAETRSLAERRSVLEDIIEADWRAARVSAAW